MNFILLIKAPSFSPSPRHAPRLWASVSSMATSAVKSCHGIPRVFTDCCQACNNGGRESLTLEAEYPSPKKVNLSIMVGLYMPKKVNSIMVGLCMPKKVKGYLLSY